MAARALGTTETPLNAAHLDGKFANEGGKG